MYTTTANLSEKRIRKHSSGLQHTAIMNITSDMQGIIWGKPDLAVTMQS